MSLNLVLYLNPGSRMLSSVAGLGYLKCFLIPSLDMILVLDSGFRIVIISYSWIHRIVILEIGVRIKSQTTDVACSSVLSLMNHESWLPTSYEIESINIESHTSIPTQIYSKPRARNWRIAKPSSECDSAVVVDRFSNMIRARGELTIDKCAYYHFGYLWVGLGPFTWCSISASSRSSLSVKVWDFRGGNWELESGFEEELIEVLLESMDRELSMYGSRIERMNQ